MPTCFVPGCKSGYRSCKEVRHFFRPPKDLETFNKWRKAIPRDDKELQKNSCVCDAHFEDDLVLKTDRFVIDGKEVEFPRINWHLKQNSVPHIFLNLPTPLRQRKSYTRTKAACEGSVAERAYRTICLSDHNYARPYHSQPKKKCVDVADCNSKTSDHSSCIAGRPPAVPQGSGDDSCQPAPSLPPRRPPYSQHQCAVYRCATNSHKMPGVTCHYFPKDECLQREWLARCRRTGQVNVRNARVCSVHFRPEDYERDLRNELLGLPLRKKLIPTAVPTLNLPSREEVELWDVCAKKLGRLRKKLRKCDDNEEGDSMDAVVQQIIMDFGYVSVKEGPIEDLDESTSSAPEDFGYVSVKEEPIEDLDESTSSAPESYEQMRQDQELPLIIKEEIDCDDYIDPFRIS